MREIVGAEQVYDIADVIGPLHRHQFLALGGVGGMDGDGHMHLGLVEQSAQLAQFAYRADSDALGAPCQTPGGSR